MANTFKFYVGGKTGVDAATEYTQKLLRGSYDKVYCDEYHFDAIVDGVSKANATDNTCFAVDNNVFFIVNDGSNNHLLMKGEIDELQWTSKKTVRISGKQSKRASSGGKGHMHQTKVPQLSQLGEVTLGDLITDTVWFANAKYLKDSGNDAEGGPLRPK